MSIEPRTLVIADLHLGHERMAKTRGYATTHEHDSAMIENANRFVRPADQVWLLGDIFWTAKSFELFSQLKGQPTLVLGNHDNLHKLYQKAGLKTRAMRELKVEGKRVLFSHMPVHQRELKPTGRYDFNIHGHLHDQLVKSTEGRKFLDPRYICVSVEQTPQPMCVEELIKSQSFLQTFMSF